MVTVKVSVLMTAYNAERYLAEAIESVLGQTYPDFEFVFINDGSTDGTRAIAEAYAKKDARLKIILRPNKGFGVSLNEGLETVQNEWVSRLDADDIMMPNRIERQLRFVHEHPEVAVAGSFVHIINESGRVVSRFTSPVNGSVAFGEFIRQNELINYIIHPSVIFRKSAVQQLGGYRPEYWPYDDVDLWTRMAERGYTILVQPEFLTKYRIHKSAVTIARHRLLLMKRQWALAGVRVRRLGEVELSWKEFLAEYNSQPLSKRLAAEREMTAQALYVKAKSNHYARRYYLSIPSLLGAALLRPRSTVASLKTKILKDADASRGNG